LDFLSKSGCLYRAAGSDCGEHLGRWDRHHALDGRAGSSGGSCGRRVSRTEPSMTAIQHAQTRRKYWTAGIGRIVGNSLNPGCWIFLHTTPYVVRIEN